MKHKEKDVFIQGPARCMYLIQDSPPDDDDDDIVAQSSSTPGTHTNCTAGRILHPLKQELLHSQYTLLPQPILPP